MYVPILTSRYHTYLLRATTDMTATTVRVVIFEESPFDSQWDDQVQSPRREDWRAFVATCIADKRANGTLVGTFFIQATVSLRFLIVVVPGEDPSRV